MFLSEWREFPSAPCLAEKNQIKKNRNKKKKKKNRVSMSLKSRASLTCFQGCFLPCYGLISTMIFEGSYETNSAK